MNRKHLSLFLVSVLIISVIATSFAQDTRPRPGLVDKISDLNDMQQKKLRELGDAKMQRITAVSRENIQKVSELDKEQLEKLASMGKERRKELSSLSKEELAEKLQKTRVVKITKTEITMKRAVPEAKIADARQRMAAAGVKLQAIARTVEERKARLKQVGLRECVNDTESEECQQKRAEALESARLIVVNTADRAIEHLNKIKSYIESSDDISEEEAASAISEIDSHIAQLEESKAKAGNALTIEEIRAAAVDVKQLWQRMHARAKLHELRVLRVHTGEIVSRAEHLERKLEAVLLYAGEKGIDITGIQADADEFSAKVAGARAKFAEADGKFKEADGLKSENVTEETRQKIVGLVKEGVAKLQEAQSLLKEAHALLQDMAKSIRSSALPVKEEQLLNVEEELPAEIGEPEAVVIEE